MTILERWGAHSIEVKSKRWTWTRPLNDGPRFAPARLLQAYQTRGNNPEFGFLQQSLNTRSSSATFVMPIFQEDLHGGRESPPPPKAKELADPGADDGQQGPLDDKIQTTFAEGGNFHGLGKSPSPPSGTLNSGFIFPTQITSDRGELIQLLKRGESPTWLPNYNVSDSGGWKCLLTIQQLGTLWQDREITPPRPPTNTPKSSPLLPAAEITESKATPQTGIDQPKAGLEIERPRSALHRGDFTQDSRQHSRENRSLIPPHRVYGEHTPSWFSTSPPRPISGAKQEPPLHGPDVLFRDLQARSRAPSLSSSYSSSFVLKPPTSPLVQSESNDDINLPSFEDSNLVDISTDLSKNYRRHSLQTPQRQNSRFSTPNSLTLNRALPNLRRDNTFPYQAHQPRRSLTSNSVSQHTLSPQTPPMTRSRRPSITPDSSPLLHASMVGSYEESILKGRMSTTPSKPLDFLAQIGVLGLGNCKPALRCPAHVTVPFPAVFYSYETTAHGRPSSLDDGPSPYVGQIDLENSLPNSDEVRHQRRRQDGLRNNHRPEHHDDSDHSRLPSEQRIRKTEKQKRRSASPKAPPGGSYRIPQKGQLQIIIKNPNKTAVKLFLVPYDLAGMEPGTKTFIRQRSYSAGPILDSTLLPSSRVPQQNVVERATLRYLVHLHICCPSRGRYYLYKSVRVVFANRVPDGKEKLRNEVSLPEPRFSVYKPSRELGSNAGASLAAEKAFRRRSAGFALGSSNRGFVPVQPIPFTLFQRRALGEDESSQYGPSNQFLSPDSGNSRPPTAEGSDGTSMSWISDDPMIASYDKLNKGDAGYGGNSFPRLANGQQIGLESLLARKLRGLDVGLPSSSDQTYDEMNGM